MKINVSDLEVDPEFVKLKNVVKSGNGAAIPFYKEFIGEKVYVILKRETRKIKKK